MAATIIPTRFQLRRDTAANWTATNPTPGPGEPCIETDTGLRKLGDGSTPWNSLLYQLSGPAYDFANLADGDTPIWDLANKRWKHGPGGKVYQAGTGIAIANPTTATPTISSALGSIALSGNPATYAALPTGLGAADAGKAYLVQADGLVYIWSGTAWPAQGAGVRISNARYASIMPGTATYTAAGAIGTLAKAINYSVVKSDPFALWDATNLRFVAPAGGVYAVSWSARSVSNSALNLYLSVNGAIRGLSTSDVLQSDHTCALITLLAIGDFVEAFWFLNASTSMTGSSDASFGAANHLSMLGPLA